MAMLAWIFLTSQQAEDATALNGAEAAVAPREIDNPSAASLGAPVRIGDWVLPARLLEFPAYSAWRARLAALPIASASSTDLFLPPTDD